MWGNKATARQQLLSYKRCPLSSVQLAQKSFCSFLRMKVKAFQFLYNISMYTTLQNTVAYLVCAIINYSLKKLVWRRCLAVWKTYSLGTVWGWFLHSVQIQLQWQRMCNKKTFACPVGNRYIQSTIQWTKKNAKFGYRNTLGNSWTTKGTATFNFKADQLWEDKSDKFDEKQCNNQWK